MEEREKDNGKLRDLERKGWRKKMRRNGRWSERVSVRERERKRVHLWAVTSLVIYV